MIYKILRPAEWAALKSALQTLGSAHDQADGFIHFSVPAQLPGTLDIHYKDAEDLVLAELDADQLGSDLLWEPARHGSLFPHLYGPLRKADIVRHWPLSRGADGRYALPDF